MATSKRIDPLAALCDLVVGEQRYTLAEANAMGCYTAKQVSAARGLSAGQCLKEMMARFERGQLRRVKVIGRGSCHAYGKK